MQASSEVSRKYSAAAKALQGEEGMEGSAGARSRPVTGELRSAHGAGAHSRLLWVGRRPCQQAARALTELAALLSFKQPTTSSEEGDYHLLYSDKGTRVCLVASEPVTSAANDWVGGRAGAGCGGRLFGRAEGAAGGWRGGGMQPAHLEEWRSECQSTP